MQSLAAFIFDFDGTLMDTRQSLQHALSQTLTELEHPLPNDPYELTCLTTDELFRSVGVTDIGQHARAVDRFQELHAPGGSPVEPFPGVATTLAILRQRGYRLAIATNEIRALLDPFLVNCGIGQFFHATICADEVTCSKPDPEMAHQLLLRLGCKPEETLVVGDSPLDLAMGRAAGCQTCAVTYGSHTAAQLKALGPDVSVQSFVEILDLLPAINRTVW